MDPERVIVVIPTYNEAESLGEIITRTLRTSDDLAVLVVDDASPDRTGEIADKLAEGEPRLEVLHRPGKGGLGPAYIAGLRWGLERGFDRLVEMDADLSHDPAVIPDLVEAAQGSALVIGSRYVPGGRVQGWSWGRHILSRAGNLYARVLLGFPIRDSTSGFRCFRREVLEAIALERIRSDGYAFQVEAAYRAWRMGFRLREIPITFVARRSGASKLSRRIVWEALVSVTAWALRDLPGRLRAPRAGR
ncbi:MAG: polyprenol monophosphomannose synthase [Actinomycetota bacterium]